MRQLLGSLADRFPSRAAVIDGAGMTTFATLAERAERFALELAPLAPARVVIYLPQSAGAVALLAACEPLAAALVSVHHGLSRARACVEELGADRLLTVDGDRLIELASLAPGATGRTDEPGLLILTSGTTAQPKCARHSWATLTRAVRVRPALAATRWLLAYPLSHFAALQVLAQCISNGGTLVIPDGFAPDAAMAALVDHEVAYLSATPTYLRRLVMHARPADWARTRLAQITLGGEIVDQSLLDAIARALPAARVTHIYATTELGEVLAVSDGRVGFDAALLDGERMKIVDGELFVKRTPRAMLGYLGQASSPDPWCATGDLVEVTACRAYFRGRRGDVINVGGSKVNPVVVEEVIRRVPGVAEVRVVAHPSSIVGSLVKAIVCLTSDGDRETVRREVQRFCSEQLAPAMVPRLFEFADRIELTPSQKLVRRP